MSASASVTSSNPVAPATPTQLAQDSQGKLNTKTVTRIDVTNKANNGTQKFLRVLAIMLIVISAAAILAGLTIAFGLLAKGTAFIQYTPYIIVGIAIMGKKGAIAATVAAIAFGVLGTVGGIMLLRHANAQHTTTTITNHATTTITNHVPVPVPSAPVYIQVPVPVQIPTSPTNPPTPVATSPTPVQNPPATVKKVSPPPSRTGTSKRQPRIGQGSFTFDDDDGLTEFPAWVYNDIQSLKSMSFCRTSLKALPAEMGNLVRLETFKIAGCKLTSLNNVEKVTSLVTLDASDNTLIETLPPDFGKLVNLDTLNLAGTSIRDLTSIERFTKLVSLDVSRNEKLEVIPEEIANLTNLKHIYINASKLNLLPESVRTNKDIEIVTV